MNIFQVDGMRLGARCSADRSRNIFRVVTVFEDSGGSRIGPRTFFRLAVPRPVTGTNIGIGLGTFFRLTKCDLERRAARIGPRTFFGLAESSRP